MTSRGSSPTSPGLTRRGVLRGAGWAGVTLLVTGTGALSYRAYDNGVLDAGAGTPYDAWQHWDTDSSPLGAVAAAILAANPHNTQAWRFTVGPSSIEVRADRARWMTAVDPLQREHHVGIGCAIENLTLALAARGLTPTVALQPDPADPELLARVAWAGHGPPGEVSPLYRAIGHRHSDRGPYRAETVAAQTLADLTALADDEPTVQVRWLTTAAERAETTSLVLDATQDFIDDPARSKEAFSWFRNDRDQIDAHRDGPTLDAQGLDPMTLTLAKLLPASSRTTGDAFWLEQTRTVHTATAAAYGVLTVTDATQVESRLRGGTVLQRIHLAATAQGLGLQHMNQVTEAIDRQSVKGMPATFAPRFARLLGDAAQPLVTFRVGVPVRSARPSPRRRLADVTA
jgi:nitroreductase